MKTLHLILLALFIATTVYSQQESEEFANISAPYFNIDKEGLALNGYDPTEYFLSNKALKGSSKFQFGYKGATYHFVTEKNKTLFKENPDKYLPQFGGYCAYGIGKKYGDGLFGNPPGKYPVNPKTFKIIDNKLYLFYNDNGYNILKVWEPDENENLERANQRWKDMNNKK